MRHPLLALADVHRATTVIRGRDVELFLFDHHRTAFTLWCHEATRLGAPPTLVTLDRHMDLGMPNVVAPPASSSIETLDVFARHRLAPSNDNHIVAALDAGALADAVVVARSHKPPSLDPFLPYRDTTGTAHRFAFASAPAAIRQDAIELIERASNIVLDVDLDCFTTMSDGDPEDVVIWDEEQIDLWLRPPGSAAFWDALLPKLATITVAREPFHCGGIGRGARLWRRFEGPFFRQLLGTAAP